MSRIQPIQPILPRERTRESCTGGEGGAQVVDVEAQDWVEMEREQVGREQAHIVDEASRMYV